jgi:NADH:ubiquinone oxidoreductase subunit 5 (subunit L)/multisubunit Na+/H+ antiporter MnhA subunit
MGIFGILRMLLILNPDYTFVGSIILSFGIISALYGVMLAIIQHNLKKLLAYHSIENIGIIGIGIGIGCIGIGKNLSILCYLGFAGALLHTLNHALFKSLLFFTAGNVNKAFHTMNIEKLGGIVKKMPQTTLLFLIAAIAICGIPPFNGFVSEFIIYSGLYSWMQNAGPVALITIIFCILGLVLTGGLAIFCFAKAFGVAFLGNTRVKPMHVPTEMPALMLAPLYIIVLIMLSIGLFPHFFLKLLYHPVALFLPPATPETTAIPVNHTNLMQSLAQAAFYLLLITGLIFILRILITKKNKAAISPTWACGYNTPVPKTQYSAASFVRPYIKLFRFVLLIFQREKNITNIFPSAIYYETHPYDKLERILIDMPIKAIKSLMGRFVFLQNGQLQVYILYGIVFIALIIGIPYIQKALQQIVELFKLL